MELLPTSHRRTFAKHDSATPQPRRSIRALALATCAVVSLLLCACGPLANIASGEQVFILKKMTRTQTGNTDVYERHTDWQGNCLEISVQSDLENRTIAFEHDQNGYVTRMSHEGGSGAIESITVDNAFDSGGRLASSSALLPNGQSVTASYAYYGDTNRISSISYEGLRALEVIDSASLSYIQQFPDASAMSDTVYYSEDGHRTAFESDGATTPVSTASRDDRKGQTVESGDGNPSIFVTYNENGYPSRQAFEWDDASYSNLEYTIEYEYEPVLTPSPAVATFARLY